MAFNWSQISGLTKVFGLMFVTASFLSAGLYIYKESIKLKIAGVTFSTIGALLIPFNGIAVYNFILIDKSYFGLIWALTSLVSLLTYFGFLKIFKESFFKYISVLATLSFVESFVNIGNLDNKYYILGSILTGFILMILSIRSQEKSQQGSVAVYNMSAHIIIPASLVMGLLIAVSQNELFTQVTSLAILMAAVFYLLNYFIYKDKYSPYAFSFLMFIFAAVYSRSLAGNMRDMTYFVMAFWLASCVFSILGKKYRLEELTRIYCETFSVMGTLFLILNSYRFSTFSVFTKTDVLFYWFIALTANLITYWIYRSKLALVITQITLFSLTNFYLKAFLPDYEEIGAMLFGFFALSNFALAFNEYLDKETKLILNVSANVWVLLSLASSFNNPQLGIGLLAVYASVYFLLSNRQGNLLYSLASPVLATLCLTVILQELKIDSTMRPLMYVEFNILWVLAESFKNKKYSKQVQNFVTINSLIVGVIVIFSSRKFYSYQAPEYWQLKNLVSYFTSVAFATSIWVLGSIRNDRKIKYAGSLLGLFSVYRLLDILRVRESLVFNLILSLYLLVVAEIEERRNNKHFELLEYAAIFVMFLGIIIKVFDNNPFYYALFMMLEGFGLLSYGVVKTKKLFTYAGMIFVFIALLSQTYEYLTSMPRWIVTSILGAVVLGTALYLLHKRK